MMWCVYFDLYFHKTPLMSFNAWIESQVAVVSYKTRTELRVYNPDAVLPLGLIVYSEK
ncbi:hypothetical protein EST38_g12725 [Candolleomyces aberdarensis]|uniref:Uncharacterized protein n=1 Tax=Candolleomyces aberdarensis TaxID=2316362 RepID=A0A4V1Q1X7_9AGAR|nr:hypothetical protein EST38_g12725 [Candolleomyces aberdarensis]